MQATDAYLSSSSSTYDVDTGLQQVGGSTSSFKVLGFRNTMGVFGADASGSAGAAQNF